MTWVGHATLLVQYDGLNILIIARLGAELVEGGIEHADDLRGFIGGDRPPPLVPQHRHRHAAAVVWRRRRVDLVQEFSVIDAVGDDPLGRLEGPSVLAHEPVDDRQRDKLFQALENPEDHRAVRPGTGMGYIEMIPARLGGKTAAARPRFAVPGDPVAEPGVLAPEPAIGRCGVTALIEPFTVLKKPHVDLPK
mgnify:CR=1 FL=1